MKKTVSQNLKFVLHQLEALTYDELGELDALIRPLRNRKYDEEKPAREARWEEERLASERKRTAEAAARPSLVNFLKKNLKVGMIVKVKGTKNGGGYREIISIDNQNDRESITAWKLQPSRYDSRTKMDFERSPMNIVTTNSLDKIYAIFDGTDFISVRDMLKTDASNHPIFVNDDSCQEEQARTA